MCCKTKAFDRGREYFLSSWWWWWGRSVPPNMKLSAGETGNPAQSFLTKFTHMSLNYKLFKFFLQHFISPCLHVVVSVVATLRQVHVKTTAENHLPKYATIWNPIISHQRIPQLLEQLGLKVIQPQVYVSHNRSKTFLQIVDIFPPGHHQWKSRRPVGEYQLILSSSIFGLETIFYLFLRLQEPFLYYLLFTMICYVLCSIYSSSTI